RRWLLATAEHAVHRSIGKVLPTVHALLHDRASVCREATTDSWSSPENAGEYRTTAREHVNRWYRPVHGIPRRGEGACSAPLRTGPARALTPSLRRHRHRRAARLRVEDPRR